MAPEVLNCRPYNYKADMWSIGVSMFEALYGIMPFIGNDKQDLTRNVNLGLILLPSSVQVSSCCLDFLSKCLRYKPGDRITVDHALNHPFINPDSPQYMDCIDVMPILKATKSSQDMADSKVSGLQL